MKLILHFVRKDARYLRWELLLWTLLLAIRAAFIAWEMQASFGGRSSLIEHSVLDGLVIVMTGLITVQLVQSDPAIGSTAFWMTRPIARAGLFASKLLFALLTVAGIPMVVGFVLAVALGISGTTAVPVVLTVFVWQLLVTALIFLLATITVSHSQFLLVGISLLVVVPAILRYLPTWLNMRALQDWSPMTLADTRTWVLLVLTMVLCLSAALYQHIRKSLPRTVGLAVASALLLLAVVSVWPWDLLAERGPSVDRRVVDPAAITLSLAARDAQPRLTKLRDDAKGKAARLFGTFSYAGVPSGVFLEPVRVDSRLRFGSGPEIRTSSESEMRRGIQRDGSETDEPQANSMLHAFGDDQWTAFSSVRAIPASAIEGSWLKPVLADVPEAAWARHGGQAGVYSADVTLDAYRYAIVARLPLQPGADCRLKAGRAVVAQLRRGQGPSVRITLNEVVAVDIAPLRSRLAGQYVLRNRTRRQFFSTFGAAVVAQDPMFGLLGRQLRIVRTEFYFLTESPGGKAVLVDDNWLAEADLVRLEPVYLGRFTAPLRVDNFVLSPAS